MEATLERPVAAVMSEPTGHLPGSQGKIEAMSLRESLGQELFVVGDQTLTMASDAQRAEYLAGLDDETDDDLEMSRVSVSVNGIIDTLLATIRVKASAAVESGPCKFSIDQTRSGCTRCEWCASERDQMKTESIIDRTNEIGSQRVIKHVGLIRDCESREFTLFLADSPAVNVPESDVFLFEDEDGDGSTEIHYHSTILDRSQYVKAIEKEWKVLTCGSCDQRFQVYQEGNEYCGDCLRKGRET